MDYLFYSLYRLYSRSGTAQFPEDCALIIIAIDSASIILSIIYIFTNREYVGLGAWYVIWGISSYTLFLLLTFFYDCKRAINRIKRKSKATKITSLVIAILITIFAIWVWIFEGIEYFYKIPLLGEM